MRKIFIECETKTEAQEACPWASYFIKCESGYWCYESVSDYQTALKQI